MVSRRMRPSPSISFALRRSVLSLRMLRLQSWTGVRQVRQAAAASLWTRSDSCHQYRHYHFFWHRRLDLNWCTIVHLVLFNLSQSRMRKYYDLDSEIMPFLNEHWDCLQLHQLSDTQPRERCAHFTLLFNHNGFSHFEF